MFPGGSPWATLLRPAMSRFFWSENGPKPWSPFHCYSSCSLLSSIDPCILSLLYMVFLLDFYRVSVAFLWDFSGDSIIFYGVSKGISGYLCFFCTGFLWGFKDIQRMYCGFPLDCNFVSIGFLWHVHEIIMGGSKDFYGRSLVKDISMRFRWGVYGVSKRKLWNFYGCSISMVVLLGSCWVSMRCLW